MFNKILIANRGEIACRVIRSAKKLGIATVAVYSDADAHAQHVLLADEAVHIGASPAAQSYLQSDRIIQAALSTGAQAIHPGYGFLSENDQFAEACEKNNITFIGPPVSAILAMGLKATSKALMEKAGVPLTPGYHGTNQDAEFLKAQADQIGYPVLIKASAGGGGKGMRLVESSHEFINSLSSCKSEAKSSFGNDDVLIERYVVNPRHIEVQVFGDKHGNYVHLFERDCSVQRRHQKVLEEAPAPKMPESKLEAMRQAAIDAARAVNYVGAGTVEFIVEQDGTAYFMEMNTRLQVEHPVTEMITGEDLVEWQLRVAYGEPLPKKQSELKIHGHALEARVYAEDPDKGFLPAIGKINYLHYPEQNSSVRVDSGIVQGDEITTFYDPMIAKLIVWGENREEALVQMHHALSQFHVEGLGNNISFLDRLVTCESFKTAQLDTNLIQREDTYLFQSSEAFPNEIIATAALIELSKRRERNATSNPVWASSPFWRSNLQATYKIHFEFQDQKSLTTIKFDGSHYIVEIADEFVTLNIEFKNRNSVVVEANGKKTVIAFSHSDETLSLFLNGKTYSFKHVQPQFGSDETQGSEANLKAPMPGAVTQVFVSANQSVKKDEVLLTLEAMKMEYAIRAPADGIVLATYFQKGDQVKAGDELVEFQAVEENAA